MAETGVSRSATSRVQTTWGSPGFVGAREIGGGGFDQHRRRLPVRQPAAPMRLLQRRLVEHDAELTLQLADILLQHVVGDLAS